MLGGGRRHGHAARAVLERKVACVIVRAETAESLTASFNLWHFLAGGAPIIGVLPTAAARPAFRV